MAKGQRDDQLLLRPGPAGSTARVQRDGALQRPHTQFSTTPCSRATTTRPTSETVSDFDRLGRRRGLPKAETQLFQRFPQGDAQERGATAATAPSTSTCIPHRQPGTKSDPTVTLPGPLRKRAERTWSSTPNEAVPVGWPWPGRVSRSPPRRKYMEELTSRTSSLHAIQFEHEALRRGVRRLPSGSTRRRQTWVMDHVEQPAPISRTAATASPVPDSPDGRGRFFAKLSVQRPPLLVENARSPESTPRSSTATATTSSSSTWRAPTKPETIKTILRRHRNPRPASRRWRRRSTPGAACGRSGRSSRRPSGTTRLTRFSTTRPLDGYDFGLAAIYRRRRRRRIPRHEKLKTLEVDQHGQRRESFKLLKNALGARRVLRDPAAQHLYEHLRFTDPTRELRCSSSTRSARSLSRAHQGPGRG